MEPGTGVNNVKCKNSDKHEKSYYYTACDHLMFFF